MKVYEIVDGEEKISIGCLLYFEREKSFVIELKDNLDEWTAPLLFAGLVKRGKYTVGRELSRVWVNERVIPSDRQNIDSILAGAGMLSYDEMILLVKSSGKCSQDSMHIKRLHSLPEYIRQRIERNLKECVPCDDFSLLCFFNDATVRKVKISEMEEVTDAQKIISDEMIFKSAHLCAGGYAVTFNNSIDIEAGKLYKSGIRLHVSYDDFIAFIRLNIMDSSECCAALDCSRQNLTNYLSKDNLTPVKKNVRGNLYTKGNVYRNEVIEMLNNS